MKTFLLLAAVANLSASAPSAATPRGAHPGPDDTAIITRFEEMVSADLPCAQLAMERGHSKEVRDLAKQLVSEHGLARQLARDVAIQLNVTLKSGSDGARRAEHARVVKSLQERPDIAFDVLFLRHEVDYHKELTDLINTEWIPAAKNADLSALLSQAGPALEAHGKMAADLWQKVRPER